LKFTEGLVARMGKKRIEGNLDAAKRVAVLEEKNVALQVAVGSEN
jgi:hypothetical protein